ncbi:hypothetical protein [Minwuia sp.]|uniref:hypothetical protein n=1 Tax=Minwuia sp. TaxID=2493630 RepID=UPI003A907A2D
MRALSSRNAFNDAAPVPASRRKAPPPVSVRLTWDEYDRLRNDAGSMAMAAHIRLKLFGECEAPPSRKAYTRKKTSPSSQLVMLGKMLGALGESDIAANLRSIAKGAETGAAPLAADDLAAVGDACAAIMDMRERLIAALGVKAR